MKILEKDRWADLLLDTVGDDFEKATEFHKQFLLWEHRVVFEVAVGVGIFGLIMLGMMFGMYWAGMEMKIPPGETDITMIAFLWMGSILGAGYVCIRDNLFARLKKRKDNIAYHWDRMGDEQCK